MHVLGQIPGAEQAIKSASEQGGWLAVFVVVLVLAILMACGFILRAILNDGREREKHLNTRVSELDTFIRTEFMVAMRANSEVMGRMMESAEAMCAAARQMTATLERFVSILDVRPCLLPSAEQRKLLKEFDDTISTK
jgi:Na+/phosphate symporter